MLAIYHSTTNNPHRQRRVSRHRLLRRAKEQAIRLVQRIGGMAEVRRGRRQLYLTGTARLRLIAV